MSGRDFWTRRRAAVAAEADAETAARGQAEAAEMEAQLDAREDAEILAELHLADPDTLETSDAVRDFLTHTLPERLKTRALRRLWRLNPALANLDGLVDYGEDYTDSATVVENLQTTYRVGKGMLAHLDDMAAKAEAADVDGAPGDAADGVAETADAGEVAPLAAGREDTAGAEHAEIIATADAGPDAEDATSDDGAPPELVAATARRMTFTFDAQGS